MARFGVSFVGPTPDLYSVQIPAVVFAITCYIEPRYNDTGVYVTP